MVVRYEARPVLVAVGEVTGESTEASPLCENERKGSGISCAGDGDGRALELTKRRVVLVDVGDASRDSVLRNVDLRFGGGVGRAAASRGRAGSLTPG